MSTDDLILCTVFRCSREKEMYIYVDRQQGKESVPEELLKRAGELSEVMTIKLHAERKLARVKAVDVIAAIRSKGFFLQLPPEIHASQFTMGE